MKSVCALKSVRQFFRKKGCKLNVVTESLSLEGILSFGPFATVSGDIMGPFRTAPFMQCRHSVFSMRHAVNGTVDLNGQRFEFENGTGYLEGDRGSSFPKRYVWTQAFCGDASIMLSVAEVPYCGLHFIGCIGFVYVNGSQYRIATYRGAKVKHISDKSIDIEQGNITAQVRLLDGAPQLPARAGLRPDAALILKAHAAACLQRENRRPCIDRL